jgi:hypothetical protein
MMPVFMHFDDTGSEIRDQRSEIRDQRSEIREQGVGNRD